VGIVSRGKKKSALVPILKRCKPEPAWRTQRMQSFGSRKKKKQQRGRLRKKRGGGGHKRAAGDGVPNERKTLRQRQEQDWGKWGKKGNLYSKKVTGGRGGYLLIGSR